MVMNQYENSMNIFPQTCLVWGIFVIIEVPLSFSHQNHECDGYHSDTYPNYDISG